jgi:hypothetical protein
LSKSHIHNSSQLSDDQWQQKTKNQFGVASEIIIIEDDENTNTK